MESILQSLNPEQKKAVLSTEGNMLILAGAGTGKTKVLTTKIAHILNQNLAYPSQILAVTFTNKAAKEMKERIKTLLEFDINGLWLGTFHSISARFLRRHAEFVGLTQDFNIIDDDDQKRLIKKILKEEGIDPKEFKPKNYLYQINSWKDKGLFPADIKNAKNNSNLPKIEKVYSIYQDTLKNLNSCDFNDLLLYTISILRYNQELRESYSNKFRYVLVDEYQDTNTIQNTWLKYISGNLDGLNTNLSCVGDDDQSIYGWRGAEIKNILNFEKDFGSTDIVRLEQNYRSTQNILSSASTIISNNKGRHGKTLWSDKGDGEKVKIIKYGDGKIEANSIAKEIKSLIKNKKCNASDTSILVRAGYQTRLFEEAFLTESIPYKVVGGLKFYDRKEIKDCISYLKLVINSDNDLAFERVVNVPRRGVGDITLAKVYENSKRFSISLFDSTEMMLRQKLIKGKAAEGLKKFINDVKRWNLLIESLSISELAKIILSESGYISMWKNNKDLEAESKISNINEFIKSLNDFSNLQDFLEYVSLISDNETNSDNVLNDSVNIMTMHASKGLEFDVVFLPAWEEGSFPNSRVLEEGEDVEEERRLAYVAITRAKKLLYITHAKSRFEFGEFKITIPSRFIDELPSENIQKVNEGRDFYAYDNSKGNSRTYKKKHTNFTNSKSQNFFEKYKIKSHAKGFNNKKEAFANSSNLDNANTSSESSNSYRMGVKVLHKKFEKGTVIRVEGEKITVSFLNHGIKTILKKFLNLK